jgi:hypothetical protein
VIDKNPVASSCELLAVMLETGQNRKIPLVDYFRARHQPDFEWRVERKSYTVNPVEEYTPKIVTSRR